MRTFYLCEDSEETQIDYAEVRGDKPIVQLHSKSECIDTIKRYTRNGVDPVFVVDLKMEDDDEAGFDIIRAIRKKDALKRAPIIVVTTAAEQETINTSYELGANAFIKKNDNTDVLREDMEDLYNFWEGITLHDRHRLERIGKR